MPLGWGSSATLTSADLTGARQYTRLRGPLLVGAQGDVPGIGGSGASLTAPHIVNVSTMRADVIMTGGITMTSSTATTLVNGFVYIPTSTYTVIAASPVPTPAIANAGAALAYDTATSRLCVFTTVANEWRFSILTTV
jgi:hypothetical protein